MTDTFSTLEPNLQSPYSHAFAITPNNTVDLDVFTRAIYVGGAGNIRVDTIGGEEVLFTGLAVGDILPVRVKRVYATNTTATLMIGLY